MSDLFPTGPTLWAFLLATLVLAVTPGPGVLFIVTRTLSRGRGAGLASVGGVALGNFGNAVGASLGLSALFAVSSAAYAAVKFAGAAYLFYLGIQALQTRKPGPTEPNIPTASRSRIVRDGFLVALLNPKTTLFFAAFLPQFIQAPSSPVFEALALSAVFVLIAATTDSMYVLLADLLAPALTARESLGTRGRYIAGSVYFGLGIYAALSSSRSPGATAR